METNATKRTDIFQIDPRNIVVMDDFNARRDFDLEELKEQIKAKGVLNPITVLPFKDEDGIERYKLVDGERRYKSNKKCTSKCSFYRINGTYNRKFSNRCTRTKKL